MERGEMILRAKELKASGKWDYSSLLFEDDGAAILDFLRDHAKRMNPRGNCFHGANSFGIHLPQGDMGRRKEWISRKLGEIHSNGYVRPSEVRGRHSWVYSAAQSAYGSYQKAMDAWKRGSYRGSAERNHQGTSDEGEDMVLLRSGLEKISFEESDLSRSFLRNLHPELFNMIKRLRGRTAYAEFIRSQGLGFEKVSGGEKKMEGEVGERFTMLYLYASYLNGEIENFWPNENVHAKIVLERSTSSGNAHPDFLVREKRKRHYDIIEVKSGYNVFTDSDIHGALRKYLFTNLPEDATMAPLKTRFTTLHLHFPGSRVDGRAKALILERRLQVVGPEEVYSKLSSQKGKMGQDIIDLYQFFVKSPLRFIRGKEGEERIGLLSERAKSLYEGHSPAPF